VAPQPWEVHVAQVRNICVAPWRNADVARGARGCSALRARSYLAQSTRISVLCDGTKLVAAHLSNSLRRSSRRMQPRRPTLAGVLLDSPLTWSRSPDTVPPPSRL